MCVCVCVCVCARARALYVSHVQTREYVHLARVVYVNLCVRMGVLERISLSPPRPLPTRADCECENEWGVGCGTLMSGVWGVGHSCLQLMELCRCFISSQLRSPQPHVHPFQVKLERCRPFFLLHLLRLFILCKRLRHLHAHASTLFSLSCDRSTCLEQRFSDFSLSLALLMIKI